MRRFHNNQCQANTSQTARAQVPMHPTGGRFAHNDNELPWARYERLKRDIAVWARTPAEYERSITALAKEVEL